MLQEGKKEQTDKKPPLPIQLHLACRFSFIDCQQPHHLHKVPRPTSSARPELPPPFPDLEKPMPGAPLRVGIAAYGRDYQA